MTLSVEFYKPYADELAAKGTIVVLRVAEWMKRFDGVEVERVSMYELKLLNVPREKILEIKGVIKEKIVEELGWQDEPSNVVSFAENLPTTIGDSIRGIIPLESDNDCRGNRAGEMRHRGDGGSA